MCMIAFSVIQSPWREVDSLVPQLTVATDFNRRASVTLVFAYIGIGSVYGCSFLGFQTEATIEIRGPFFVSWQTPIALARMPGH